MGYVEVAANLSALIESTEDLIWSVDLDYRLITFNQALARNIQNNFGKTAAMGLLPEDMLPPERALFWPPFYERVRRDGPLRIEYALVDGRTLELAFNPIVVEEETTGISVFGKDITERKAAEESYRFLAAMVESSEDAIHATNLEGIIVSWNRGAEAMCGYTRQEMLGKHPALLVPPEDAEKVCTVLRTVLGGDAFGPFETVLRRKDGGSVDVSLSVSPIRDAAGAIIGASCIARDIGRSKGTRRR